MGIHKEDYFRRSYRLQSNELCSSLYAEALFQRLLAAKLSDFVIPYAMANQIPRAQLETLSATGIRLHLEISSTDFSSLGTQQDISNIWHEVHILPSQLNTTEDILFVHELISRRSSAKICVILPALKDYNLLSIVPKLAQRQLNLFLDPQSFSSSRPRCLTVEEIVKIRKKLKNAGYDLNKHPGRTINGQLLNPAVWPDSTLTPAWISGPELSAPKYSIVSPCFNNKEFFANVIQHLLQLDSDPSNFELIIVDDGSTDSPSHSIQAIAKLFPEISVRYYYWPKPNGEKLFRAGQSRTLGALKARGDYLVFVDSDILVNPDFLSEVDKSLARAQIVQFVRHHIQPKYSFADSKYSLIDSSMTFIEEADYWGPFYSMTDWMAAQQHWKYTCSYALALSKSDFWLCGGFSSNYISYGFEDTELGYRMAKFNRTFELNPSKVFHLTAPHQVYTKWERQMSIADSAKIFYLNHFEDQMASDFGLLMSEPFRFFIRLKDRFSRQPEIFTG